MLALDFNSRVPVHYKLKELHDKYGNVIRAAPHTLVYRSPQTGKDIYGHRKSGAGSFLKDPEFYLRGPTGPDGTSSILTWSSELSWEEVSIDIRVLDVELICVCDPAWPMRKRLIAAKVLWRIRAQLVGTSRKRTISGRGSRCR